MTMRGRNVSCLIRSYIKKDIEKKLYFREKNVLNLTFTSSSSKFLSLHYDRYLHYAYNLPKPYLNLQKYRHILSIYLYIFIVNLTYY